MAKTGTEAPSDVRGLLIMLLSIIAGIIFFINNAPAWKYWALLAIFISGFWHLCLAAYDYGKWHRAKEEKKDDLAG